MMRRRVGLIASGFEAMADWRHNLQVRQRLHGLVDGVQRDHRKPLADLLVDLIDRGVAAALTEGLEDRNSLRRDLPTRFSEPFCDRPDRELHGSTLTSFVPSSRGR